MPIIITTNHSRCTLVSSKINCSIDIDKNSTCFGFLSSRITALGRRSLQHQLMNVAPGRREAFGEVLNRVGKLSRRGIMIKETIILRNPALPKAQFEQQRPAASIFERFLLPKISIDPNWKVSMKEFPPSLTRHQSFPFFSSTGTIPGGMKNCFTSLIATKAGTNITKSLHLPKGVGHEMFLSCKPNKKLCSLRAPPILNLLLVNHPCHHRIVIISDNIHNWAYREFTCRGFPPIVVIIRSKWQKEGQWVNFGQYSVKQKLFQFLQPPITIDSLTSNTTITINDAVVARNQINKRFFIVHPRVMPQAS